MKYILALLLLSVNNKEMKYSILPSADINKTFALIKDGDEIEIQDGTMLVKEQWYLSGKNNYKIYAKNPGKVKVSPDQAYKLNPNTNGRGGCYVSGNNISIIGIDFAGFVQKDTFVWNGLLMMNCNDCIFDRVNVYLNGAGAYLQGSSSRNLFINCDFYENNDPLTGGGNADGLDLAYCSGTNNVVRTSRAWSNSDDGFDCFENNGHVWFDGCWAWGNGKYKTGPNSNGVGFKLGSTSQTGLIRKLTGCIGAGNRLSGCHQEEAMCSIEMDRSAFVSNGEHGILFNYANKHTVKNTFVYGNGGNQAVVTDASTVTNVASGPGYAGNTQQSNWPQKVSVADFVSLDDKQLTLPRKADGSLPDITFLKLSAGSDLTGIGPFGSGGVVTNLPPTANAGMDVEVTLMVPMEGMSLTGEGSDPEGGPLTYKWTDEKGNIISNTATVDLNNILIATGVYIFTFTVTDNQGLSASDDIIVTVVDKMPVSANAGPDITTLLLTPVTIIGTATGAASFKWTAEDGTELSKSPTLAFTGFDTAGVNKFKLTVTDASGKTASDEVIVTVKAATVAKKLFTAYVQDNTAKTLSKTKPTKVWKAVEFYDDKTIKEV